MVSVSKPTESIEHTDLPKADTTPTKATPDKTNPDQASATTPTTPGKRIRTTTPHTPDTGSPGNTKSNAGSCTPNASEFVDVAIHTAKCSECDKRNMSLMRRCPGCTFQICNPCFEKREAEGKSLEHGTVQSPASAAGSVSVMRRRPFQLGAQKEQEKKRRVKTESMAMEVTKEENKKTQDTHTGSAQPEASKESVAKQRGEKRKARAGSFSDDENISNKATHGSPSSKSRMRDFVQSTATVDDPRQPNTTGRTPGDATANELMQSYGVNTPQNPYQQHLLSRQVPIIVPPATVHIPASIRRHFQHRSSAEQVAMNIQDQVRARMASAHGATVPTAAGNMQPNIRTLVAQQVGTIIQGISLDRDEQEGIYNTAKEEARKWASELHNNLAAGLRGVITRGLDMKLEHLNQQQQQELVVVVQQGAARKLKEIEAEKAKATLPAAANPSAAGDQSSALQQTDKMSQSTYGADWFL